MTIKTRYSIGEPVFYLETLSNGYRVYTGIVREINVTMIMRTPTDGEANILGDEKYRLWVDNAPSFIEYDAGKLFPSKDDLLKSLTR